MRSYKDDLEQARRALRPPEDAYERLLGRHGRQRRNSRIVAGVLGLAIASNGLLAVVSAFTGMREKAGRDLDGAGVERGLGSTSRDPRKNWARLSEFMRERSVDVALLSEVATSVLHEVDGALYEVWGTRGRDRKHRDWCTAIVSPHGCDEVHNAQAASYRGRRPNVRFESSRPKSWTAGVVPVPDVGRAERSWMRPA